MSGLHEECGVFGIYSPTIREGIAGDVYYGLYALQHRGQESCGIAVNNRGIFESYKDIGLVNDVSTRAGFRLWGREALRSVTSVTAPPVQTTAATLSPSLSTTSRAGWR